MGPTILKLTCAICGNAFERSLWQINETKRNGYNPAFCSRQCVGVARRGKNYGSGWEGRYPEKSLAHKSVENAIASGRLKRKPCERCGSKTVHAHHEDYSKPLEVTWLCPRHHKERHRELEAA